MRSIYVKGIILILCIALVVLTVNVSNKIKARFHQSKNDSLGISQQEEPTNTSVGNGIVVEIGGKKQTLPTKQVKSKLGYTMEYIEEQYKFDENEIYSRYSLIENPQVYFTIEQYAQYDKIDSYFDTQENSEKIIYKKDKNKIYRIEMFYPEEEKDARNIMLKMIETFKIL